MSCPLRFMGPLRDFPVILHQEVTQRDLHLVSSKEPPRTCMLPKAKSHMFWGRSDELRRLRCILSVHSA